MKLPDLPVVEVLGELDDALCAAHAVLEAPTGAGKTTVVPAALFGAGWLAGRRIVMLQPRRMAARAAARRISALLGEPVGRTAGYRTRLDTRCGPMTRIEVVTEGILVRMLQTDPALEGIGLVIFDEFHERSIAADLGLALCLDVNRSLRDDLRILVMSATLESDRLGSYLGGARVVRSEGRSFDVSIEYCPPPARMQLDAAVASTVRRALAEHEGDVLVFLPGAAEIRGVARRLESLDAAHIDILPLHGMLPDAQQDRAIAPSTNARRRVVLSTPIAETSLTIEGVRVVIDSGLHRAPRYSPATGMTRLETVRISQASAAQRAGRAGRVAPGHCYRLWSRADHARLRDTYAAQIEDADLAPLLLELATWGTGDPAELSWLDPPPAAPLAQARDLLLALDAISDSGMVTAHGKRMAALGLHPRLAHMLLKAGEFGAGHLACRLAALVSERDPMRFERGHDDADIDLRIAALVSPRAALPRGATMTDGARRHVTAAADQLMRRVGRGSTADATVDAAVLVALAWPERIAVRREAGGLGYRMANGRGAALSMSQPLMKARILAIAALHGGQADARIHLAAALDEADLETHFGAAMRTVDAVSWDPAAAAVRATRERRIGHAVLSSRPIDDADPDAVRTALLEGIALSGLGILPWTSTATGLRDRIRFVRALQTENAASWPEMGESALLETLHTWLGPHLSGVSRATQLARLDLAGIIAAGLDWQARKALDRLAPVKLPVPSGSRIALNYAIDAAAGETPVLAVRIQEMFGASETPRIADGRVPVTLHLLSPAGRPLQITRDLASFWAGAYRDVRRDMKGRYPKHPWPEDGLAATPSRRPPRRR